MCCMEKTSFSIESRGVNRVVVLIFDNTWTDVFLQNAKLRHDLEHLMAPSLARHETSSVWVFIVVVGFNLHGSR